MDSEGKASKCSFKQPWMKKGSPVNRQLQDNDLSLLGRELMSAHQCESTDKFKHCSSLLVKVTDWLKAFDTNVYTSDYLEVLHMLRLPDSLSPSKVLVFPYSKLSLFTEFQNTYLFIFSINFCLLFPQPKLPVV